MRSVALAVAVASALGCVANGARTTRQPEVAISRVAVAEDNSCLAAFDSLQAVIRHDYPGYAEKSRGHEQALASLADSVREVARTSDEYSVCIPAMKRWIRFFRDPHLMVWQGAPPSQVASASPPSTAESAATAPAAADPDRPTVRVEGASLVVVRLPSLEPEYMSALDSLVVANRVRLLSISTLVVDMRGDGGGCTCTYAALLPFIYGGPYREAGQDVWTSPANVAFYRSWLTDDELPDSFKTALRDAMPRLEAAPNHFVELQGDTVVRLDTVYPLPSKVAVLVDDGCASSCEDFVLMARQSRKVTIIGPTHTAGVHDYGNVRALWLPGWRRLRIPTSRSRRLPAGAIDNVGIAPDVLVPAGERDTVRFAARAAEVHRAPGS